MMTFRLFSEARPRVFLGWASIQPWPWGQQWPTGPTLHLEGLPPPQPTSPAAGMWAGPPGTTLALEDHVHPPLGQGPGSGTLSSPRFIYLSFVWGEMRENQVHWAVLAAVGGRKACLFLQKESRALWPWPLGWLLADNALLSPCARRLAPACLPACLLSVQWACCCPLDLAAGKERRESPEAWTEPSS